jgi:hypothetical protein
MQPLPKHPAQSLSVFTAGTFEGFCDFFTGFQARLCFTENLALPPGFFMAGCASGRRSISATFSRCSSGFSDAS